MNSNNNSNNNNNNNSNNNNNNNYSNNDNDNDNDNRFVYGRYDRIVNIIAPLRVSRGTDTVFK